MNPDMIEDELKLRILRYVHHFGKNINDELVLYVLDNFEWGQTYQTETMLLSRSQPLQKTYSIQTFLTRLQEAVEYNQGMSLVNFILIDTDGYRVVWRGNFTSLGFISSPHYEITSCFNEDLKLVKQYFRQLQ